MLYSLIIMLFSLILLALAILVLILVMYAWSTAIHEYIEIIEAKVDIEKKTRRDLWIIGIFATPIALGLLACATPDVNGQKIINPNKPAKPASNQLPEV